MNKLLTIIVPTYNMEKYLDRCLSSLVVGDSDCDLMLQLEVLVVNDGSTDSSLRIAHHFVNSYPNTFIVIDKSNGGYGSCINVALPLVKGKYVKILDADDWFETECLMDYLCLLPTIDVDLVLTDFDKVDINGEKISIKQMNISPCQKLKFGDHSNVYTKMWMHNVTYRRAIFDGLNYHQTEGIYYTDMEWIYLPMSRVETCMYFPKVLYHYFCGRLGQSMDPEIHMKNLDMRIKGILVYIDSYQSCLKNNGTRNGVTVNMDYLYIRSLSRCEHAYFNMLSRQRDPFFSKYLRELDDCILRDYPEFYKALNNAVYPNADMPQYKLQFQVIRFWRKYGTTCSVIQIWFINHYLGICYRWHKLLFRMRK